MGSIAFILALLAGAFGLQSNRNANTTQNNSATAQFAKDDALSAKAAAQAEAQARATQQSIAETNFQRAEAQRLAAEATKLLLSHSNSDVIALLSLRSMHTQYTSQGDAALVGAAGLDYTLGIFKGHENEITGIVFSPDGKYLLTCSVDKDRTAMGCCNQTRSTSVRWSC